MSESEVEGNWAPPPPVSRAGLAARARGPAGMPVGSSRPMTEEEYTHAMTAPEGLWARMGDVYHHPHRCMWSQERGTDLTGAPERYCKVLVEDPRVVRYCVKHALLIGYPLTIEQQTGMQEFEARHALRGMASEAVAVVGQVMKDQDVPPGVRVKAAESVLDRVGLHAKSEVGVEGRVETTVVDITQIIRERLDAKRARLLGPEAAGDEEVVEGEIVELRPAGAGEPEIKPPPGF